MSGGTSTCHVVHMMYRFSVGGLENVVIQLINRLPRPQFRHTIVALTQADGSFAKRIERDDVQVLELRKPPGQPFRTYPAALQLLRKLRPDVLHTCNIAALEFTPVAALAGVPLRIHAEHGWDVADPDGTNRRYRLLRRLYRPFVHDFIAVSPQLERYLREAIGVPQRQLHFFPNGVDTSVFRPSREGEVVPEDFPFRKPDHWVVGTVGRLEPIKNQMLLVDAFAQLVRSGIAGSERLRLAIVGGGALADAIQHRLAQAGLADRAWIPGPRADIPAVLRCLDCFVLPSLAEGTSCTLQEAMATGLPIIATDVGGNAALLEGGDCGTLVPTQDVAALSNAIAEVFHRRQTDIGNQSGLRIAQEKYALAKMVADYEKLFRRN